jgi:hypothetical protein
VPAGHTGGVQLQALNVKIRRASISKLRAHSRHHDDKFVNEIDTDASFAIRVEYHPNNSIRFEIAPADARKNGAILHRANAEILYNDSAQDRQGKVGGKEKENWKN